jgi:hypothetical protein|tara:strand:+ start:382 stop:1191 length:810 start_codon:yes stop_codon:yes gene_type:complete
MLNLNSEKFLSKKQINDVASSVFTNRPSSEVTDKYTFISTEKVIDDMEVLGWKVSDAKEVKARTKATVGFQKHLLVFRNNDVVINGEDGDTVFPQILLTNSHDGKNSFQFTAGLFRMICENGLVIADTEFEDVRMRHMGYTFEDLQVLIKDMVEKLPLTVESMNKMKNIELEEEKIIDLAKSLLDIRVEGTDNTYDSSAIEEVLETQRKKDEGVGLWEVFNRVQENIIEGNFHYKTKSGKVRQARIIKNFKQDIDLNRNMFAKAMEYAA